MSYNNRKKGVTLMKIEKLPNNLEQFINLGEGISVEYKEAKRS